MVRLQNIHTNVVCYRLLSLRRHKQAKQSKVETKESMKVTKNIQEIELADMVKRQTERTDQMRKTHEKKNKMMLTDTGTEKGKEKEKERPEPNVAGTRKNTRISAEKKSRDRSVHSYI